MASASEDTRFDRYVRRIKDQPWIAIGFLVLAAVIGLGKFTDSLDSIRIFLERVLRQTDQESKTDQTRERVVAHLRPKVVREVEVWDEGSVFEEPVTSTTQNATIVSPYIYEHLETLDEGSRVVKVTYDCVGGGCPWCYNPDYKPGTPHPQPMIEYSPSFSIRKKGREVLLTRYCNGGPATLKWVIQYVKRVVVRVEEDLSPIKVYGGETFEIMLPAKTIDWSIAGELSSGENIMAKKGNTGPFLEALRIESIGTQQRLVIRFGGQQHP